MLTKEERVDSDKSTVASLNFSTPSQVWMSFSDMVSSTAAVMSYHGTWGGFAHEAVTQYF